MRTCATTFQICYKISKRQVKNQLQKFWKVACRQSSSEKGWSRCQLTLKPTNPKLMRRLQWCAIWFKERVTTTCLTSVSKVCNYPTNLTRESTELSRNDVWFSSQRFNQCAYFSTQDISLKIGKKATSYQRWHHTLSWLRMAMIWGKISWCSRCSRWWIRSWRMSTSTSSSHSTKC